MKRVVFHPQAEVEFLAVAEFYEAQRRGLGLEFIAEVRRAARALQQHPELGHRFSRRLRRLLVQRFPYGLLYRIEAEDVRLTYESQPLERSDYRNPAAGSVQKPGLRRTAFRFRIPRRG